MAKVETLFILRDADQPLSVGDDIEAQGFQKYMITVKQIVDTQPIGDKIQWKIKGVRKVIAE